MSSADLSRARSTVAELGLDELTSSPHSLHRSVAARQAEYVRSRHIQVKIGTWNVAALPGTDKDLAGWFVQGKGLDSKLATIDLSTNPAIERQAASLPSDPGHDGDVHLIGGDKIDLYVLGLQEAVHLVAPVTYLRPMYMEDEETKKRWKTALETALPNGYQLVSCDQLAGLLLLVYASPEIAPTISNVSSFSVATGLMGFLSNKGSVATRIVLGEATRMVFINCHLASGHDQTAAERRVWDITQILSRTKFSPITYNGVSEDEGDAIGGEDFAFWFGDLNFRLERLPGEDIRRLLLLHTRGEYDLSKKDEEGLEGEGILVRRSPASSDEGTDAGSMTTQSTVSSYDEPSISLPDPDDFDPDPHSDPASLQATLDSLLPHDQLRRMVKERKVFHDGWQEGAITFLPSYKYDVGTVSLFDSSEKQRAPSWCDRILYRTRAHRNLYDQKVKEEVEARKKDEEMKARGMEHAGDDDEVLFDYDPDQDIDAHPKGQAGLDYDEYSDCEEDAVEQMTTKDSPHDRISLDIYASHQRIISSDHKPIVSIFTVEYDAVVPELKAKVHADVVRELDRAENEGRPGITIVIDGRESATEGRVAAKELPNDAVDFGEVRFRAKETSTLTLANTGRVSATFSFVDKSEESGESGPIPWLTTSFAGCEDGTDKVEFSREVTLEPGETVKAFIELCIGAVSQARMLNDGEISLEDVLILRVTGGRDHFIPVRANWSPTCIGRSIEELIRVPDGGLRAFVKSQSEATGRMGSIPCDLPVQIAAPKELFKLTEALESLTERALADEQMLEECKIPGDAGWPFDKTAWIYTDEDSRGFHVAQVVDVLDGDRPIHEAFMPESRSLERLEAVSEVLLLLLDGLTDGIITMPLWARIEQASLSVLGSSSGASAKQSPDAAAEDDKAAILDILSSAPNHNIAFVFLTTTLAKIISELTPLSKSDLEALKTHGRVGRRSLSFRRNGTTPPAEAIAAMEKRQAKERLFAEVFGKVVCRTPASSKGREKSRLEDRQRAILELFLKQRDH